MSIHLWRLGLVLSMVLIWIGLLSSMETFSDGIALVPIGFVTGVFCLGKYEESAAGGDKGR